MPTRADGALPLRALIPSPERVAALRAPRWGDIDLNLLVVFDAVMQERNLTRAGRRLGLSQPATSHALARLRVVLQDELFVRAPDGMRPTPRAEQMAEPVREALRALQVTLEPVAFEPGKATNSFTLAVNNHAARAVVPTLVRQVERVAPRISLTIRSVGMLDTLDQLDSGSIDVALCPLVDGGERFKCVCIMSDDYVAVLDRAHAPEGEMGLSVEQLAARPHIVITTTGDDTSFVDTTLAAHGLTRRVSARVPFLSLVLMMIGTDGIAVVPRRVAMDLAQVCPLAVRELPFASPRAEVEMIWHRRLDSQPAHRWLREAIRTAAQRG
jgi:DNA-binding transcriptional LysR family regulator